MDMEVDMEAETEAETEAEMEAEMEAETGKGRWGCCSTREVNGCGQP